MLNDEDWAYLKRFILASGSLKDVAAEYGVSYPTVRARLDALMEKVRAADGAKSADEFTLLVQSLVIEGRVESSAARELLQKHRKELNLKS